MQKVVIITGASRGIGAATAKRLAAQGYSVCVNYRTQTDAATQVVNEIEENGGEPNRVDRLSEKIPLKRGGTVDEVANAISWLLSNEASYVTGSFIDLAGGN
ncbi:SDR family oxidoreductase [Vibrio harveyi]|uniref:SDR family oxidoreductase n=1 Tax=Vibrio harveyi TaxID=669 RepID=UPI0009BC37B0|nr:SDR family oxidoreductase [Vibrio harveyi]